MIIAFVAAVLGDTPGFRDIFVNDDGAARPMGTPGGLCATQARQNSAEFNRPKNSTLSAERPGCSLVAWSR
jgi:hypothetical protein